MRLGTWLIEKAVDKAATAVAGAAIAGAATASAVDVDAAVEATEKAKTNAPKKKAEKQSKATSKNDSVRPEKTTKSDSDYDIKLICAKIAICSYIIHADDQISVDERDYVNDILNNIYNEYGEEAYNKAVNAYISSKNSFMNVQDYLRKVNLKDIKIYLQAADEIAELDGVDESETKAIQRIKDYVTQQENDFSHRLDCPSCSGIMRVDNYGYKAVCSSCGREIIIDSANAPDSAYRELNKAMASETPENTIETDTESVSEKAETSNKSKKGKVALKVALGVMTGGVSLIPDAVNAVKKKDKKDSN